MHCPNRKYGCEEVFAAKDLMEHVKNKSERDENVSKMMEEIQAKMFKLEGKSEVWFQMLDLHNKNHNEALHKLRIEFQKELREKETQIVNRELDLLKCEMKVAINTMKTDLERQILNNFNVQIEKQKKITEKMDNISAKIIKLQQEMRSIKSENKIEMKKLVSKNLLDSKENLINRKFENLQRHLKIQEINYSNNLENVSSKINSLEKKADDIKSENRVISILENVCEKRLIKKEEDVMENRKTTLGGILYDLKTEIEDKKSTKEMTLNDVKRLIFKLETSNAVLKPQINSFNLFNNNNNNMFRPDFTWEISGMKELLKQEMFEIESEEFKFNSYPEVRVRVKLEWKKGNGFLSNCSYGSLNLRALKAEDSVHSKLTPTVYFVLRDYVNEHKNIVFTKYVQSLEVEELSSVYNAYGSVAIEVYVEPPMMDQQVYSYDGILNWTIDNYRKRKEVSDEGLTRTQESPYFYTGPCGYRVRAYIHMSMHSRDITISIEFLKGEFDEDLPKIFPHLTTVTLSNGMHPESSIVKINYDDIRDSRHFELKRSESFNFNYDEVRSLIIKDTLFCKVVIEAE